MLIPERDTLAIPHIPTLDLIPEPVWFVVPGQDRIAFNAAWSMLTAKPRSLSLEDWLGCLHPEDRAAPAPWSGAAGGEHDERELRIAAADGHFRRFLSRARRHGDSEASLWIGTLVDVEEQQLARERERLLAAANAAFAADDDPDRLIEDLLAVVVPEHADYAVVDLFAPDGRFERLFYAGPSEIGAEIRASRDGYLRDGAPVGTSWQSAKSGRAVFVPDGGTPADWPEATRELHRRFGVRSAIVVPLAAAGGVLGSLAVARLKAERGGFSPEAVAFYADIAARTSAALQRVRTVRELIRSEQLYRTLADEMPQLIGLTSPDGRVFYLNRRSAEYTGVPLAQRTDNDWRAHIHPNDVGQLERDWARTIATGERLETRYRMRRHDGVYRWFLNQAVPVRDPDGTIVSWIGTAIDIDEHHRRENALQIAVEAGQLFAQTLDTELALRQLAELAVRHVADWCGVHVYDEAGQLVPKAIAHADPGRVRLVREYLRRYPIAEDEGIAQVAATGNPRRIGPISDDAYDAIDDPERRELARSLGLHAVMDVPLAVGDQRFGVFSLALAETKRVFDDDDERLAAMLAQRAAISLGNARLFERQREVARKLQSAFLPAVLPQCDGTAFEGAYVPGTHDLSVGGDWYDAELRDDGRLTFSIGDVAGHGLEAAVPMGKMRQTFRVLGALEDDPASATVVADGILRGEHPDVFVTAFLAIYDPATRALRYANAGHPAPFVRAADGSTRRLEAAGVPLGLAALEAPVSRDDRLEPDALLVAFTDGLIELDRDIEQGERALAAALAHPAFAVCSTPASMLKALMVRTEPRDDIAILTVRAGGGADWTFHSADADAAHAARQAFVARLRAWNVADDRLAAAELVLGEIVGNVARYAPGLVDLRVRRTPAAIELAVLDRGPGLQWLPTRPSPLSEGGRGLFLIEALSEAVRAEVLEGFGSYLEVRLPAT